MWYIAAVIAVMHNYRIINCNILYIPGELAPALRATVNIHGQLVDFVVVHMGNDGYVR